MGAVKAKNLFPVLCVALILGFLVATHHKRKPRPALKPGPPPVSRLRLSDEIKPLERRWLLLDARVAVLRRGKPELDDKAWLDLFQEAMGLLSQAAVVDHHFSSDLMRLNGEKDPVTGIYHSDYVKEAYGYVDCLGRCTMSLSGQVQLLHRISEGRSGDAAKDLKRKAADYDKQKAACLKEGQKLATLKPVEHPLQIIVENPPEH